MHRFERCQSTKSIWEEPERGTFFGTTLRSMQQPMRRISWAASLCLPLPVDKYTIGTHLIVYREGDIVKQPMKKGSFVPKNVPGVGWGGVGGS